MSEHSTLPQPPGPAPLRFGIISQAIKSAQFIADPLNFVRRRFSEYGDIYYVPDGDGLYAFRHPDHMQDILSLKAGSFNKDHTAFHRLAFVLGDGLLTADGEKWKRHRRMIQPAFHRKKLNGYAELMIAETEALMAKITPNSSLDIGSSMMELTLSVVNKALFGHDVGNEAKLVAESMAEFQEAIGKPELLPEWIPTPGRKRLFSKRDELDRIIYGIIDEQRQRQNAGKDNPSHLLAGLLQAIDHEGDGGGLSEKEVRDELVTLFLAGHETTAQALTWTWFLLAQHPEWEEKMHAEIDQVVGHEAPSFGMLERLEITDRILAESMRLYPPAYVIARKVAKDVTIGDWDIPAGSEAILWSYMTHHDPRFWPNPKRFDPDRFLPEAAAKRHKFAYMPFGGGPRACIGKQFALIEAKLILATLGRRFRFELPPGQDIRPKPRITLIPNKPIEMVVRPRV